MQFETLDSRPISHPLRAKLGAVLVTVIVVALTLAGGAFAFRTSEILRAALENEMLTLAETLGDSGSAAVLFTDRERANEILAALGNQESVQSAFIFDKSGAVIGQYVRAGLELSVPLTLPEGTEVVTEGGIMTIYHPIVSNNDTIGTIVVRSTTARLAAVQREQLTILGLVLSGALAFAVLVAIWLGRSILNPVDELVRAVAGITKDGSLTARAKVVSRDELGFLTNAFNRMLDGLQAREYELQEAHAQLAERVEDLKIEVSQRTAAELALAERSNELERLNEKLKISNRELDEFAYVASHDMQEPLRKIQTFADVLKRRAACDLSESNAEYLDHMVECATRMRNLINDLLELSRVVSKGRAFRSVDLDEIIREVTNDLQTSIESAGATVDAEHLPSVWGDPSQLYSLFLNVVGNALKYRRSGVVPKVSIRAVNASNGEPSSKATIIIQDNGIGFEQKHADRIFQPFQRLHGRSEYTGTGIGLAICARIVERHSGTIKARANPGEGAEFEICLPINEEKREQNESHSNGLAS